MPKLSDRKAFLQSLDFLIRILIVEDEEESEEFHDLMELRIGLENSRYLNVRTAVPKCKSMLDMLFHYPDGDFNQIARCQKLPFLKLYYLIKDHPIFHNNSRNCQHAAWYQLLVVLSCLGCDGNGASYGRNARQFGVGHGTIRVFTIRVFKAIISLHGRAVKWPDAQERQSLSASFDRTHGLKGCVGIVDGTLVHFAQRPHVDGQVYWNRKHRYSMNVQLVCNIKHEITYYVLGWPGSVYDGVVFSQTSLFRSPANYLSEGEYIAADSGYGATNFLCTPYRSPAALVPCNTVHNHLFSAGRVIIEHVNAELKGRFSSLRGVRIQVKKVEDFERVNEWILVCIILHNLLLSFDDKWKIDNVVIEDNANDPVAFNDNITAGDLRVRVQNHLLEWFNNKQ